MLRDSRAPLRGKSLNERYLLASVSHSSSTLPLSFATQVTAREAMELHDSIVRAGDLRQPVNFNEQMMRNSRSTLDQEVGQSLIQLLSSRKTAQIEAIPEEQDVLHPGSSCLDDSGTNACGHESNVPSMSEAVSDKSVQYLITLKKQIPDEVGES